MRGQLNPSTIPVAPVVCWSCLWPLGWFYSWPTWWARSAVAFFVETSLLLALAYGAPIATEKRTPNLARTGPVGLPAGGTTRRERRSRVREAVVWRRPGDQSR